MKQGSFSYPMPTNEPINSYAPGTAPRLLLKQALTDLKGETRDIPMVIGGKEVRTDDRSEFRPPHEKSHLLGTFSNGGEADITAAIEAALAAREQWSETSWENRANIFLKAAELLATKYRYEMNAATMLGQSKNAFQSEIDSVCELIDFLRFNVHFLDEIYKEQPISGSGMHNRLEWRGLEGFVLAVTPFNFTAIGGNLAAAPAMCGNAVVWKPSDTQVYSAHVFMKIMKEAGLPDGVINMVTCDGPLLGKVAFAHPELAAVHFTGSTKTFQYMWKAVGENIETYKSYPRIVGETGGKDFVLAHKSADVDAVATALIRGAFEYQGQKCSAASRAYLPSNIADDILAKVKADLETIRMGPVDDFGCFVNAVIDERSFQNIAGYIDGAVQDPDVSVLSGGGYDDSKGWFVEPTVLVSKNPKSTTMVEEIFGPVLTVYVYDADDFEGAMDLVDTTSEYALTGAVISQDRYAVERATDRLRNAAGNFYINDKPTGAVVGQQPFGGARASGTNDKAGSKINLYRWLNARTIKETFVPPVDYRYPFLDEE